MNTFKSDSLRAARRAAPRWPAVPSGDGATYSAREHVIEYRGSAIRALTMEERMTVCNMSIEAGARAGMIAPDETTYTYLAGRPRAPQGGAWEKALEEWRRLPTDPGARFARLFGLFRPVELLENLLNFLLIHANALILHRDPDMAALLPGGNPHFGPLGRVFHCVRQ